MTNEEKELLVAYLVDSGKQDPDGDVEAQFQDWYQVREKRYQGRRTTRRSRTSGGLSKRTRNRERRGWTDCAGWR